MPEDSSFPAFVALEPDGPLASLIQRFKDRTRSLVGEQLFLADPPHLTVYLAVFPSADDLLDRWPQIAARHDDLSVELTGWHVFEADALTGCKTLVCNIAAHDKVRLRTLQREIVNVLAPLRDDAATRARYAPRMEFLTQEQQRCVAQVGFPYLGDGWEPHFTIASIRPENWDAVWAQLGPQSPHGSYRCSRWRLNRLHEGRPEPLDGLNQNP